MSKPKSLYIDSLLKPRQSASGIIVNQACQYRKYCTCVGPMPKQHFIAMACDSNLHAMKLWRVVSVKFNIAKKIAGLAK